MVDPPDNTMFYVSVANRVYLVESAADIYRRNLDNIVNHFWERCEVITGRNFRIKKDLWSEKTLITNVDSHFPTAFFDLQFLETTWIGIIAREFLDNVGTNIGKFFLDPLGCTQ